MAWRLGLALADQCTSASDAGRPDSSPETLARMFTAADDSDVSAARWFRLCASAGLPRLAEHAAANICMQLRALMGSGSNLLNRFHPL
jgi:hypothetical protein